jgi:hypothetical protein
MLENLYPDHLLYFFVIDMEYRNIRVCGFGYLRIVDFYAVSN